MATTKQAVREQTNAYLADEYLADIVYDALLERGEPSKVSEITLEINNPRITFPVVRRAVADSPRFLTLDRMWDLSARYLDRSRPTERNLTEVLQAAGKPLSSLQLATELSAVYNRGSEIYSQLLAKLLKNEAAYFRTSDGRYGLNAWLPVLDADEDEDVLFDNDLTPTALAGYADASAKIEWSPAKYADTTFALIDALGGQPVPHRIVGILAWTALHGKYDARKHLIACLSDARLTWVSGPNGGRWITRAQADRLETLLEERSTALAGEDQEDPAPILATPPPPVAVPTTVAGDGVSAGTTDEAAAPTEAAAPVVEAAPVTPPLEVTEDDIKNIERIISDRGAPVDVNELLALQYEVVAGDPSYQSDVATLEERLRASDRLMYVGAGRFREPNSLPLFVYSVPEFLTFPDLQFVSMDGEIMDEEIEDEGLAGVLRQDTQNPLAQDVGDDEGEYTGAEPEDATAARFVVKAHHKEIGTFPLCQIPDGFFPDDAPVVDVVVRAPNGETHDIIVNNDLRLCFNFFGLYEFLTADSGAVFVLHRTARPYEYRFEPLEETDPQVYLTPQRMGELLALREQAEESGDLATFDIACEVLAHHPKGLDFVQTMTEVNIVRRVTRRKLASILSNYYCFMQKAGQNLWRFDAKKRDLGTDRAKRKYIKR